MQSIPHISICIPTYKNKIYLKRLLDSIVVQTFRDFEVVITDDSPDTELENLINEYNSLFSIKYYRNQIPIGSPGNWNKAISYANGKWIKIMHDDDWFAIPDSLELFFIATEKFNGSFIFSGFTNVHIETGKKEKFVLTFFHKKMLEFSPLYLFRTNYIGHPSTTLIRNEIDEWFDEKIKWVVDFEFYIRLLYREKQFYAINKSLVNIGISSEQITKTAFRNKDVEIPENLYLLKKIGYNSLKNIYVYDYCWRLMRNLKISSPEGLKKYMDDSQIPAILFSMIRFQKMPGIKQLKKYGFFSKIMMGIHYVWYRLWIF